MRTIPPAKDAREIFAGALYRSFAPEDEHCMMSPAAMMKLLFVISQGAHEKLADDIYWDLGIKHVETTKLVQETERLGAESLGSYLEVAQKLKDELSDPIDGKLLLEFFKNDFNELGDLVTIKNYVVSSEKYVIAKEFQAFAESYFDVNFLKQQTVELRKSMDLRFSDCITKTDLDIFGLVEFKLKLRPPFEMYDDGSMGAFGQFKYVVLEMTTGLEFKAEVVELPLDNEHLKNLNLTMLVFLPSELVILLKRNIGRDYTDFNQIASQLKTNVVDIKLPNMNMQKKYNLTNHFAEQAENGLRDCFSEPVPLTRMFEKADKAEIKIGHYCQHTTLMLTAPKASALDSVKAERTTDIIFDVRKKSFFYVIKSEKVLYVMGHFYRDNMT